MRSRLYLDKPKDEGADPDLRVLRHLKANYAQTGGEIAVRWQRGVFVREGGTGSTLDAMARTAQAERVFLAVLATFRHSGREVSDRSGKNFAPAMFAASPHAEGLSKRILERAMERLFARQVISVENFGPPSRARRRIVAADDEAGK